MRTGHGIIRKTEHLWFGQAPDPGARSAMRTPLLKRLLARIEAALSAAAFAEERDPETARGMLAEDRDDPPGDR
jgi:hypothetical protein